MPLADPTISFLPCKDIVPNEPRNEEIVIDVAPDAKLKNCAFVAELTYSCVLVELAPRQFPQIKFVEDEMPEDGSLTDIERFISGEMLLTSRRIVAPTATSGTNTTQVATTAFVQTAIASAVQDLDLSIVSGKLCVTFEE